MERISSKITDGFWHDWQELNANKAIFHQWTQLEKTGCIDNFRILAENLPAFRRGWFFADSDAYKWLEASFHILENYDDNRLSALTENFVSLIEKAQSNDGYLYTFNQIHFPEVRWVNLQIEHELYCHGHLIEAFVSGAAVERFQDKIEIAVKAADCIVEAFMEKKPIYTPGHEEIEIALLRLYEITKNLAYLDMGRQFIERRGKSVLFPIQILRQSISNGKRVKGVEAQHKAYLKENRIEDQGKLPASNTAKKPDNIQYRWFLNAISGKFLQQHRPVQKQTIPVGHAVRFAYLETAAAMLDRLSGRDNYRSALEHAWNHMVSRRMYITGGIGALPVIEGFGRDYELDPEFAYAETCAALGSIFWNREMTQLTGGVKYADLYEWQLYNAALVGMGMDGTNYFYNNPLKVESGIQRRPWYEVPCCPSNLSRTWAWLQKDILCVNSDSIDICQYISSDHKITNANQEFFIKIRSSLPWNGQAKIEIENAPVDPIKLRLRLPSWSTHCKLTFNDESINQFNRASSEHLDPQKAEWINVERKWNAGDQLYLDFAMPVQMIKAHENVKSVSGMTALSRGPLVYCLESVDNQDMDIFSGKLDPNTMTSVFSPKTLNGIWLIKAITTKGNPLTFIPYYLWGNRGPSQMTVFVRY